MISVISKYTMLSLDTYLYDDNDGRSWEVSSIILPTVEAVFLDHK